MSDLCILCARHGKTTRLDSGHACTDCAIGLMRSLNQVLRLAEDAAEHVEPGSPTGGRTPGFGSRPPLSIDALDAHAGLPLTPRYDGQPMPPTLLETLESWTRMIRDERQYSPYGVVSETTASPDGLSTSLSSVVTFLRREVPWMTTEPAFPIADFADEVHECVASVWRWNQARRAGGIMLPCPTLTDDGECGYRLTLTEASEPITCRRCKITRSVDSLVAIGMSAAEHEVWVDAEVIASRYGLTPLTLRKWVSAGHVRKSHGRYLLSDLERTIADSTASGWTRLGHAVTRQD